MGSGANRAVDRFQQDGSVALNGDVSRTWALLGGTKPPGNSDPTPGDICNWPVAKRSPQFAQNDLANIMANSDLPGDLMSFGFR